MIRRLTISVLALLLIAVLTLWTWKALRDHADSQITRIAESESYAARSQLVRNIDTMLRALRELREYWSLYGHLPRDQWASDAGIEISHFTGLDVIIWSDPARGSRYVRSSAHPGFDYRPTDEEWEAYNGLIDKANEVAGETISGPFVDESGKVTVEIFAVDPGSSGGGALVAVLDTKEMFAHLLRDESPGYAISVFDDEVLMYRRGEGAVGIPQSWIREGLIETTMGNLWRVVHSPTEELVDSIDTPAVNGILVAGLAIALLVGMLLFENGRARSRARAAQVAEQQLASLNRDLEAQISERTRELADRSADLETITDSVAHDLRNPLNSISANVQLLQQQFGDVLGEDGMAALQRTASAVKRMTEILNRLLGLSIVSHATFRPEDVDMKDVVLDVFDELTGSEQLPEVELIVEDLPRAKADPTLVRTLVLNLLSNAIKYTRDKPARRIEVRARAQDGVVVYSVRDNGIGFGRDADDKLFKAFERLDRGGDTDGLGLGLDIAARVVKRHSGRIWAESRQGEGAVFYFTLAPGHNG